MKLLLFALLLAPVREAGAWGFRGDESGAGFQFGPAYPTATSGYDVASRAGYAFGLHYFRCPWDWFTWGLELDRSKSWTGKAAIVAGKEPSTRLSATTLAELFTARVNLVPDEMWTVYVLGGAGWHSTTAKVNTLAKDGASVKGDGPSFAAAGGLEVFTMRNVSAFFEARWQTLRLDRTMFGVESAESLSFQVGMNYRFGVK